MMNALFVANFGRGTGYAWKTIEAVFDGVARRLAETGTGVLVAFPSVEHRDRAAHESYEVVPGDFMATARSPRAFLQFLRLTRRHSIKLLYLTDQSTWSWRYLLLRVAGVRRIVVHDRTSGMRSARRSLLFIKQLLHRTPLAADRVIAVSRFVANRLEQVNGVPASRVVCIYNGIDLAGFADPDPSLLHGAAELPPGVPVVFCAARANSYKGILVLIRAVALLDRSGYEVALVYCGDGPDLHLFREEAEHLALKHVRFLGKRADVAQLMAGADICAVPSLWAEAFGLAVVEAMAAGKPVVATRTGGIPELVCEERTGLLVPPDDPEALAGAIRRLLDDASLRTALGRAGRQEALARYDKARTIREIADTLSSVMPPARPGHSSRD